MANLKANQEHWAITFVPATILVDGKRSQPKGESPVRIGNVSITVEIERPGNEKDAAPKE